MNKFVILILAAFLLIGGGVFFINTQSREENVPSAPGAAMERIDSGQASSEDQGPTVRSSKYIEYSQDAFLQNSSKKRVLFFYASWCPICVPADKDFRENAAKIPEDVVLIRVNYNDPETDQEEKDLAKKYAVTYQHTFVQIDSAGNEVTKWNGGQTDELLTNLK
jgi:thioredoxin 1